MRGALPQQRAAGLPQQRRGGRFRRRLARTRSAAPVRCRVPLSARQQYLAAAPEQKRSAQAQAGLCRCPAQGALVQALRQLLAERDAALQRERQKVAALEAELRQLRCAAGASSSGGNSTAAGAAGEAAHEAADPAAAAAEAAAVGAGVPAPPPPHLEPPQRVAAAATAAAAGAAQPLPLPPCCAETLARFAAAPAELPLRGAESEEMVLVSRCQLELLYLKERAMDAVQEGITIADCSRPEMPLI